MVYQEETITIEKQVSVVTVIHRNPLIKIASFFNNGHDAKASETA